MTFSLGFGADRDEFLKGEDFLKRIQSDQKIVLGEMIDLIDHEKNGDCDLLHPFQDRTLRIPHRFRIDHPVKKVGVGKGPLDIADHPRAQRVLGLVNAGRIQKNDLPTVGSGPSNRPGRSDPPHHIAGSLGLGGSSGEFFSHQIIQKGGFPDIRPSDDRDMTHSSPGAYYFPPSGLSSGFVTGCKNGSAEKTRVCLALVRYLAPEYLAASFTVPVNPALVFASTDFWRAFAKAL